MNKFKSFICIFAFAISNLFTFTNIYARTYPNPNLDITNRPNDTAHIDEFIACMAHISYWAPGVSGPFDTDKEGNAPSDWSAPYVQSEIQKGVIKPKEIVYSEPATIAFAAKYLSNAKGLYQWNFINKYNVSGTEDLSAEEKMYLNVAFDNGLLEYYNGIDAKSVIKRKEIGSMLLNKQIEKLDEKTLVTDNSMKNLHVFFENNSDDMDFEFDLLKKYSNSITQVSFGSVRTKDTSGNISLNYDKPVQLEAIKYCKENGIQTFLALDNYNFFSENGGYSVYDQDAVFSMIENSDATINSLISALEQYDMDGVNITFDVYGGGEYRDKFSVFMTELGEKLKEKEKSLMVSIGAYFSEREENETIYNYDILGKCCDFVHIILYDENSANAYNTGVISEPGPNSSIEHISRVIKYAAYRIDPDKLLLGTQSYSISFNTAKKSASNVNFDISWLSSPNIIYDGKNAAARITFGDETICFETDDGMEKRVLMSYDMGFGGISSFSLTSDFSPIYSIMNKECAQRPEIISSMRKNLIPTKYYTAYGKGIRRDEFCDFIVKFIETKSEKTIQDFLNEKNVIVNTSKFSDTSSYNVCAANALGIVSGRDENTFGTEVIKRQEAAAMLSKLAQLFGAQKGQNLSFSDTSSLADWAKEGIAFTSSLVDKTNSNRVMNGIGNEQFSPFGVYTRAQTMMTMIRLFNSL